MKALSGVRVLDASWYAPGPFCSLVCASLGADVVKLEPLSGDPLRALDPEAFERLNAGKRGLRLDLKRPEGRDALLAILRETDVLIEGFRPGVAERLGLDYPSVSGVAPALVYLSISGYGRRGPYRDRAGHDVNYMALAGALGGARAPLPLQVADFGAGGLYGVAGILAALLERGRTGSGRYLDLSMHRGLLAMGRLHDGAAADRLSGRFASYAVYETRDGEALSVGALEPKFWERFCRAIGRDDLVDRAEDPATREEVARSIASRDLAEWEAVFEGADACVEPLRSPREAAAAASALHPRGDPASPWPFDDDPAAGLDRAPRLGEHTEAVLAAAGLSSEAIAALRSEGVC